MCCSGFESTVIPQSSPTPAWTAIYEGVEFKAISHPALSGNSPSTIKQYSMRPVHSRPVSEADNIEFLARKIRPPYFVFSRYATKPVLNLAKSLLGWLGELLAQNRALQGRHAVSKPKAGEATEITDNDEEAVVYEDPRSVKRSRRDQIVLFPFCCVFVGSLVCSDLGTRCHCLSAQ